MRRNAVIASLVLASLTAASTTARAQQASSATAAESPYAAWKNGPPSDPDFFPIGVWLQDPRLARRYRALGVNTFVGLWKGPTEQQLSALKAAGMKVICDLNPVGRRHLNDPMIVAWMLVDEPDNVDTKTWSRGPKKTPEAIRKRYENLRRWDPHRPVWLNLGQGVANERFKGRGAKREDYPKYVRACDIISFDCYPVANIGRSDGENFLWYVAKGVGRLRQWGGDEKIVWNFVECTAIKDPKLKATPVQVKAEVWMSLIFGSRGIVYFCHEMKPKINADALLDDPEMSAAVRAINAQVRALAPVLNAPELVDGVTVTSKTRVPVRATARQVGGSIYVLSVGMRNAPTEASFTVPSLDGDATAEVLGEERELAVRDGRFEDAFEPYAVHLYRIEVPR